MHHQEGWLTPPRRRGVDDRRAAHSSRRHDETVSILLVDDKPANILALEAVLESPEYRLVVAHSGRDAVRLLEESDFAVVLLDVQMPDMDGFETASG